MSDSIFVICGSSEEDGQSVFWVLDTTCTRLFVIDEETKSDIIKDMLLDFLGVDNFDNVLIHGYPYTDRGEKIYNYLKSQKENKED